MKINVMAPIVTPDGTPVWREPPQVDEKGVVMAEGVPTYLYNVLIQSSLQPAGKDKTYSSRQQVIRYILALEAWKAQEKGGRGFVTISKKVVDEIEDDMNRIYGPIVAGQALLMMGYVLPDLRELFGDEIVSALGGSAKAA